MKKIVLMIFCVFGIVNLNAKEINNSKYEDKQIEFNCNNEVYKFNNYIESTDKIVLSNNDKVLYLDGKLELDYNKDDSIYTNKNKECIELTIDEKLNLENEIIEVIEEEIKDNNIVITKYNTYKSLKKGYILNTDKYNEKTKYYTKEDETFNELNKEDIDLEKVNEYYVLKNFKLVSSTSKEKDKKYYENINDQEFITSTSELNKENALNMYEEVKDYIFDKNEYTIKEEDINNINDKYLTEENSNLDYVIIKDNLYYKITIFDNDENEISCRYYDTKGNELFKEYELKEITYYKEYYIVKLLNDIKYIIYDKDKKLINEYKMDENYELGSIYTGYNKLFLNFINNENNEEKTLYIEKYYEVNYTKYIIAFSCVVFIILASSLILKKK